MEIQPDKPNFENAVRQAAIQAGMITIKTVIPGINSVPDAHTVGTEFLNEVVRPWPNDL